MSSALVFTLFLVADAPFGLTNTDAVPSADVVGSQDVDKVKDVKDFRESYRTILRKSAKRRNPDLSVRVPQLVSMLKTVESSSAISKTEKNRMSKRLRVRLVEIRKRLSRRTTTANSKTVRNSGGANARAGVLIELIQTTIAPDSWDFSNSTGGGSNAKTANLIEIIQNEISPESWDVNGGYGSIGVFVF